MLWPDDKITIADQFQFVLEENQPTQQSRSWLLIGGLTVAVLCALAAVAYFTGMFPSGNAPVQ
jgi:hypothetical protein